ncbi:unnamed protein product [Adineta steineri]|uniref:Uncharacterized protein n=1 Tax=Adineta steineri TaxID=433720 RepID=A0A814SX34_9BILA|nr:unnamed protein product [Adineta steineri]
MYSHSMIIKEKKMLIENVFFFFFLINSVYLQIQINLYDTNWSNENLNIQHDCLIIPVHIEDEAESHQTISYCMGEWPSQFNLIENNFDNKYTFSQLQERDVTSEQLYYWSASIDVIEEYQNYLDKKSFENQIYYNCTLPYFGSKCQYTLEIYNEIYSTINDMIHNYYKYNLYEPTLFTCYDHLKCNRGPYPSCLDWTEICDGKTDCFDTGIDEKDCWQLEMHQCNKNEFQCSFYAQCIPLEFLRDQSFIPDCLDQSDNLYLSFLHGSGLLLKFTQEPSSFFEDLSCAKKSLMIFGKNPTATSSCVSSRGQLLLDAMFSMKTNLTTEECWKVLKCFIKGTNLPTEECSLLCKNDGYFGCIEIIKETCPDIIFIPLYPIFRDHIYLAYNKSNIKYTFLTLLSPQPPQPTYVCYDEQFINIPKDGKQLFQYNNKTCRHFSDSMVEHGQLFSHDWFRIYVSQVGRWLHKIDILIDINSTFCNQSIMYQCINSSQCISKTRLLDNIIDCYYEDDESKSLLKNMELVQSNSNFMQCQPSGEFFPWFLFNDGYNCDCNGSGDDYCFDENLNKYYFEKTILFQTICDKHLHLKSNFTENKNETDETNCEYWPSLHIYNRCNGFWDFLNGSDELNCDSSLELLNCSQNYHVCVSAETSELMCLPIEKVNDNITDCIGAADEPTRCDERFIAYNVFNMKREDRKLFGCHSNEECILGDQVCDTHDDCPNGEDEQVCKNKDLAGINPDFHKGVCTKKYEEYESDIIKTLCRLFVNYGYRSEVYFTLDYSENSKGHYSEPSTDESSGGFGLEVAAPNAKLYQQRCHRGLDLKIWLDKQNNITNNTCLCPPSYYGNICQYQNQRISLTLQFRATTDSTFIPFIIIISLIDNSDQRITHSYEQIHFLASEHCQKKFNFYLLYSSKPKDSTKTYFIHIDFYEKLTLNYRGSILQQVNYSFLPVHRFILQLDIPNNYDQSLYCLDKQCTHGKCIKYFNNPTNQTFCQCDPGWTGKFCTIKYDCLCSSPSLCIGKLVNNRSLCVCPINTMGPRCLIQHQSSEICQNGGHGVLIDEYEIPKKKFICTCSKGYSGDQCEQNQTKLEVSFDGNIDLYPSIFIHFIEVKTNDVPIRTTTIKRTRIEQNSFIVYRSLPFHIAFVELSNKSYYLIYMQKKYQPLVIQKTLNSFDQCLNISELFNETMMNYHFLRRIKYYHIPCQTNSTLLCFYDEQQFCLCQQLDQQRVTNCFNFNHTSSVSCSNGNLCKHGGKCFEENSQCPKYFFCQCPDCYYGIRCEETINGFSLSLDAILAYHTYPNQNLFDQSHAILTSSILSTIIIIIGLINSILSLITFQNKTTRDLGCGVYLLFTSLINLFLMIIFPIKYWINIYSQIGFLTNQSFLNIHCYLMDFLIRFCLNMDQWLTTFVSIERAYITIKGVQFNKKQTKLIAKRTIIVLIFLIILTNIHDPIYRKLFIDNQFDEDEHMKIICHVEYKSNLRVYNLIMNVFHYVTPFIINLISATIIIFINTKQRKSLQNNQKKYFDILKEQIVQHKNLLIGPFVLIILNLSRLIISFTSGCMTSKSNSWLFLLGYFISLIPPLLTFILFVLPSTVYKQAFRKNISHYKKIIIRRP